MRGPYRTWPTERWISIALLIIAFALRTAWLTDVPPGLHHDEVINGMIAEKALAGGWSLFYPEGQGREGLYYLFLATAIKLLGTGTFVMRLPSVFLGMLGLSAIYALTRRLFGSLIATFTLAEQSFALWSVLAGRLALRAITEPLIAALAMCALWAALQSSGERRPGAETERQGAGGGGWRLERARPALQFLVAGVLIGLTVYTYRGARALPGIMVLLPMYLVVFDRARLKRIWRGWVVCAMTAAIVTAPLMIFLHEHPGIEQLDWAQRGRVLRTLFAGDVRPALGTTVATLGAFFFRGDPDDYYNLQGRPVFEPVMGILFVIGVLIALRRLRQFRYAYLLMWFALALAPGMLSEPAPHFYRILGAQIAAFAFPAIALASIHSIIPKRAAGIGCWALMVLILAEGAWNIQDYFIGWGHKETVRVLWNRPMAEIAHYLDRSETHMPVAICTLLINRREPWLRTAPDFFRYLMRRDTSGLRFYDCRYSLVLPTGSAEALYAFPGTAPLERFLSRFLQNWLQGAQPVQGVHLSADNALMRQDIRAALDQKIAALALTVEYLPVDFGSLELLGYELPQPACPGSPVVLITWWRVKHKLALPNLTMFVHMLRAPGDERILAQQDLLSVMADTLEPGDVFAQVHEFISVPPDTPPGDYPLVIGLYDPVTGQRLPLYEGHTVRGDRLFLSVIHIP